MARRTPVVEKDRERGGGAQEDASTKKGKTLPRKGKTLPKGKILPFPADHD
jgi:hypothetical protein